MKSHSTSLLPNCHLRVGIKNVADYSPFGVQLNGRTFSTTEYRIGFQNQEKDDEINGDGNSYTADYWQYSPRIGKRWNIDPVKKDNEGSYVAFANNPLLFVDLNGADTLNINTSLQKSGFNSVMSIVNNSSTYSSFFESFISGDNASITLEFQSVPNLKDFETGLENLNGQALLHYDGNNLLSKGAILPTNIDVTKFKIVIQLREGVLNPSGSNVMQTQEKDAIKGVTITHEMMVHAFSAISNINDLVDGNITSEKFIEIYQSDVDHKNLIAGKCLMYEQSSNEIMNSIPVLTFRYFAQYVNSASYAREKEILNLNEQDAYKRNGIIFVNLRDTNTFWRYKFLRDHDPEPK